MTKRKRPQIQGVKMSFLHRVAGHSLRDRVRSSVTWEELRVEPLFLQVAWASVMNVSWTPLWGGVPGMSHWEEGHGKTQETLEGLCLSTGLGMPWGPTGSVWGEGSLGLSLQT
ncbi:hypothetical protein NQD34_004312 [Periophthalmus magnuspinnatus]|nr:hypothetical protein NQD34_004312 [Periophthalmus magnuspinnatus]